MDEKIVKSIIGDCGYRICDIKVESGREAISGECDDLNLSKLSRDFLNKKEIKNPWRHQYLAVKEAKGGKNLCITTSTSSGKSEIFILSALEVLASNPNAKVLAIYPMKALNRQQVERWQEAFGSIGKIDGDNRSEREKILRDNRVVVMTPDVVHAWLLNKINDARYGSTIRDFIKNISLIVIDELHLYKGLFGTNSAYLFRRLNNVRRLLRGDKSLPQYITASATLPSACEHSFNITGAPGFYEIGADVDGSPMSKKTFFFVEEAEDVESRSGVRGLVKAFAELNDTKSITFVEGRQSAGNQANELENDGVKDIYAFRAGFEIESANIIAEKLNHGEFKGVISTSALEIGIDIDGLNLCIIADMPHDKNSYQQRIGRVGRGRCKDSYVIVVKNDNNLQSKLLFEEFGYDIDKVMPNYEPALYLEDANIQNIQALIHVGDHDYCEYALWKKPANKNQTFSGKELFPASFGALCDKVLNGQAPAEYENLTKNTANPHRAHTLRHFGEQFTIVPVRENMNELPKREQISREQIATEGYKGAIRTTYKDGKQVRERVHSVKNGDHEIRVKRCNSPFLKTTPRHTGYVIPNFDMGNRHATMEFGECLAFNLLLKEHQTVYGYNEILRGVSEYKPYEKDGQRAPYSLPPLKTTGTVIFHPAFNQTGVKPSDIAEILYETFLRLNAFDRNDISQKGGHLFSDYEKDGIHAGDKFIALYDTNELNITARLLDEQLLKALMKFIKDHKNAVISTLCPHISVATSNALDALCNSILENEASIEPVDVGKERIIKCRSKVRYHKPCADGEEEEAVDCIYVGGGDIEGTCVLFIGGEHLCNIPMDCIETTSETNFV